MCCFRGRVDRVRGTEVFARALSATEQLLVYEMELEASEPVAMLLPLPTPDATRESAVRFLSLEGCGDFFARVSQGFAKKGAAAGMPRFGAAPLAVHSVGAYEASFIPSLGDFDRLDERFRLPRKTVDALEWYQGWGFAVFQLASSRGADAAGAAEAPRSWWRRLLGLGAPPAPRVTSRVAERRAYHPMAMVFPRRDTERLYFPTFHIHDGEAHPEAEFHHRLYFQGAPAKKHSRSWEPSRVPPRGVEVKDRGRALVDVKSPVWRRVLEGTLPNHDQWVRERA